MQTPPSPPAAGKSRRALLASLGAAGTISLAGCSAIDSSDDDDGGSADGTAWRTARADAANTAYTPDYGPRSALGEAWEWSLEPEDGDDVTYSSPVYADGAVVVACHAVTEGDPDFERSSSLVALDARTGNERWMASGFETDVRTEAPPFAPPPIIVDDAVHVVTPEGYLGVGFDGEERNRTEWDDGGMTPFGVSISTVAAESLCVPSTRGLFVVDSDGGLEWEFEFDDVRWSVDPTVTAAVDGETVYAPAEAAVYAVDATGGSELWHRPLEARSTAPTQEGR